MYKPTAAGKEPDAERVIPYSLISAVDSKQPLGPVTNSDGQPLTLADDEVAVNNWTAEQAGLKLGDTVRIKYFEPETTHGENVEVSVDLKLKAIVQLSNSVRRESSQRLTLATDPDLTPEVPGVSDRESMSRWKVPFEMTRKVESRDDAYWRKYRTTPKAFVSLATGQKLWGSRFGSLTSFRIESHATPNQESLVPRVKQALSAAIRGQEAELGFRFQPLKRDGLRASAGATPFDALFLSLSFFIIAAALILVALLFRLGVEQRAPQLGTMMALGWTRGRVSTALLYESLLVAAVGALLGVLIGSATPN